MKEPGKLNIIIFRENIEDVYAGIEYKAHSAEADAVIEFLGRRFGAKIREGSAIGVKPMSKFGSQRLVSKAIQHAIRRRLPSVTLVHKGNIMKFTEGAFRDWGYEIAKERFGEHTVTEADGGKRKEDAGKIMIKDRIADSMFQQLLLRPDEYSVIASPNLNGDYLSDATAAQVGGLGLAPGGNVGDGYAVFEATHGTRHRGDRARAPWLDPSDRHDRVRQIHDPGGDDRPDQPDAPLQDRGHRRPCRVHAQPQARDHRATRMNTLVLTKPLASVETPLLAVLVAQGSVPKIEENLQRAIASGDYKGKKDETLLVYGSGKAERVLLVGVGKVSEITRTSIRRAAAIAAKRARSLGTKTLALAIAKEARGSLGAAELAQVAIEGAAQGGWQFTELKKQPEDPKPELESVELIVDAGDKDEAEAGRRIGDAIAAGYLLTRNLQMQPGNVCTPRYLAEQAKKLAEQHQFGVTILDLAQIKKEGMGALLAVAQGSAEEPRFIVLEYSGGTGAPIALIGKGVTFDSGGISIKPALNMEDMKFDKSGATAVLGTFEVLGRLKPKINVVGLIPATENLPSGTAIKPGDVVKSHLGKTIEIINTDAEGRLILCDALSYARRFKPAAAIDAATLTGAVVIALGHHAIGMLGNDEVLLAEVRDAGERAGERCWPLPLWDDYRELLKSDVADIKNSGGRAAGTIAGAWFLREFVDSFPWVHLDIAGTAYLEGEGVSHAKGPTAIGVRLFTEFLLKRAGA